MTTTYETQDPLQAHPEKPQSGGEQMEWPGTTADMSTKPDHGEKTYKGFGRLKDKRAIITGGDSGIGRAVALAFAREGADVLISCLEEEDKDAQETAQLVRDAGRKCVIMMGDIRDENRCKSIVDRAVSELGGVDILVNNAAYQMMQPSFMDITTEQFDRTMKTNLYAMFWLCKAAVPHMKPGAAIVNSASIQGYSPNNQLMDYAGTKAAIINFTKSLSKELVSKGIRVNAVAPGPVWTPLIPSTMTTEKVEKFGKSAPMQRPGQPVEIAPAYVFLACQESSYITAQCIAVTGGKEA